LQKSKGEYYYYTLDEWEGYFLWVVIIVTQVLTDIPVGMFMNVQVDMSFATFYRFC
jgi:hypothetical protein